MSSNEGKVKCRWCGEYFEKSEVMIEKSLGPVCEYCVEAIKSHSERLSLEDFSEEAYGEWKKKAKK